MRDILQTVSLASVGIRANVAFAFSILASLRFVAMLPVLDLQTFAWLVQHIVQRLPDRRLLAALCPYVQLSPAILFQRLAKPLLRIAGTPRFFVTLPTAFSRIRPGDLRQSFLHIVSWTWSEFFRCRRSERRQTDGDTPLPCLSLRSIGLSGYVQSIARFAELGARLPNRMDHCAPFQRRSTSEGDFSLHA